MGGFLDQAQRKMGCLAVALARTFKFKLPITEIDLDKARKAFHQKDALELQKALQKNSTQEATQEAKAYCRWLDQSIRKLANTQWIGRQCVVRLPTEANCLRMLV